jgi:hypothetical protein
LGFILFSLLHEASYGLAPSPSSSPFCAISTRLSAKTAAKAAAKTAAKTAAPSPPVSSIIVIQYNNKPIVKSDDKTESPCWRQNQQISAPLLEKGASTGLPAEIRALRPSGMQVAG